MKIGLFGETYPPTVDGVGRVMMMYCQTFKRLGHDALYVSVENQTDGKDYGIQTLLYKGIKIPGEVFRVGVPWWSKRYKEQAQAYAFDVVHAHAPFLAGRAARRIARERNIPLVATFHSKYYDDFYRATHSKRIAQYIVGTIVRFYESCDEVWTVNESTAQVLRSYGYHGEIHIMQNGMNIEAVDDEVYALKCKALGLDDDVPTYLFVGQIHQRKNIEKMIDACALLRSRGQNFRFLLVGRGGDREAFEKQCKDLGIADFVRFEGFTDDENTLRTYYRRADLFLFTSHYDSASMVMREAAAQGTPSVVLKGSCTAEGIVHNVNGFLCQNNPESIADALQNAYPLRETVGQNAKESIPIAWEGIAVQALSRYQNLMEKKGKNDQ